MADRTFTSSADIDRLLERHGVPLWTTDELGKHIRRYDLAGMIWQDSYDKGRSDQEEEDGEQYDDGYEDGYTEGKRSGYNDGYDDGKLDGYGLAERDLEAN